MIDVIEFEIDHIDGLDVQDAQRMLPAEQRRAFVAPYGDAWTVMLDGEPIACGGFVKVWHGRAYAWSLLGRKARKHLKFITEAVRRGLQTCPHNRIEMSVEEGFEPGRRWALMLGFQLETPEPMRGYLPNGKAAYLYSIVREA